MAVDKVTVNDALKSLAEEFHISLPDGVLDELTHHVVGVFDANNKVHVYVVSWKPDGVGGFDWRSELSTAVTLFSIYPAKDEPRIEKVSIPGRFNPLNAVDAEAITDWLNTHWYDR